MKYHFTFELKFNPKLLKQTAMGRKAQKCIDPLIKIVLCNEITEVYRFVDLDCSMQ